MRWRRIAVVAAVLTITAMLAGAATAGETKKKGVTGQLADRHRDITKQVKAMALALENIEEPVGAVTALMKQTKALQRQLRAMREDLDETGVKVGCLKRSTAILTANGMELVKQRETFKKERDNGRTDLKALFGCLKPLKEVRDAFIKAADKKPGKFLEDAATETRKTEQFKTMVTAACRFIAAMVPEVPADSRAPGGRVPDVRTMVVVAFPGTGPVVLQAGRDSGVKKGFVFRIRRGEKWIGKVQVTAVWHSFSGGRVIEGRELLKSSDEAWTQARAPAPRATP